MTIGEKILNLRKSRDMSQEALAEKLSVSRQTISLWETDQTQPTIENLIRLKDIFGVTVDKMLGEDDVIKTKHNTDSLDTIAAALAYAIGVDAPAYAAEKNAELANYVDKVFDGEKADRIFMYNPDAIAQWIYEKYPDFLKATVENTDKEIYLATVMPSVTPVCFGTMYTGAQPSVHGIQKYEKPVIRIETLFDVMLKAGKRCALVTYGACSLGKIFLERDIDYYHFEPTTPSTIAEVNAKAAELILKDEHDLVVVYNGNYDSVMHKKGPESPEALGELRVNDTSFALLSTLIRDHWQSHNTLVGFAMDHGCHEIDGGCGSHGLDMCEDINIVHRYKGYRRVREQ